VFGFLAPFHINFEEVNLRFYVKRVANHELRRGVVFIKEVVPRTAIAIVARVLYGEPYESWAMSNRRDGLSVSYEWKKGNRANRLSVIRGDDLGIPVDGSHGSFMIEHYWGYTDRGRGRTDEYRVTHPKWNLFSTQDQVIDVDFGRTHGDEFAFLNGTRPYSVLFAKGSEVSVYKGERIK